MKHLKTSLLYPLKIVDQKGSKLNVIEKSLIARAMNLTKNKKSSHFFASNLIKGDKFNYSVIEAIIRLIDQGYFEPVMIL